MNMRQVQFIDQDRSVVAMAQVADEGGHFGGKIDLHSAPAHIRVLFEEFEEIVNGQMFAFLDEIQEKIRSLPIRAIFEDGTEVDIEDLQVFPRTGNISFHSFLPDRRSAIASQPPENSEAR